MAARGCQVALSDIDEVGVERVAEEIRARGGQASSAVVDVRDADAVAAHVNDTRARAGRLDYIFNNAGVAIAGEVCNMTLADWQTVLDIDLRGVVHGVTAAYPIMMEQGFGHIVNTASLAGLIPTPGLTAYATAKHAVVGLSLSLRQEARFYGVRVSAVCPGIIDTPIKRNIELRGMDAELVRKRVEKIGTPVEVCARAILRGVDKNRPIIVVGPDGHLLYQFFRLHPRVFDRVMEAGLTKFIIRRLQQKS